MLYRGREQRRQLWGAEQGAAACCRILKRRTRSDEATNTASPPTPRLRVCFMRLSRSRVPSFAPFGATNEQRVREHQSWIPPHHRR